MLWGKMRKKKSVIVATQKYSRDSIATANANNLKCLKYVFWNCTHNWALSLNVVVLSSQMMIMMGIIGVIVVGIIFCE